MVISGVRCEWFAHDAADATINPSSHASLKSRMVNFRYLLILAYIGCPGKETIKQLFLLFMFVICCACFLVVVFLNLYLICCFVVSEWYLEYLQVNFDQKNKNIIDKYCFFLFETGSETARAVSCKRTEEAHWRHEYSGCKGLHELTYYLHNFDAMN